MARHRMCSSSHLSPVWRQIAIINSVSNEFLSTFFDSISIFDCGLSGMIIHIETTLCNFCLKAAFKKMFV